MFTGISMTGSGLLGLAITYSLNYFGFEASVGSVEGFAVGVLAFASVVATFWGQVRRKDLKGGIVRK